MNSPQDRFRRKLANAYGKVARQVGQKYSVYRPVTMQNILDTANKIGDVFCSFTLDEGYGNVQTEAYQQYKAHCDWNKVQEGDVLHDGVETFVITWNRAADMAMAIKADYLVEIWRPDWSTADGLQPSPVRWARNVPASFTSLGSTSDSTIPRVGQSTQEATWEVRIWTTADQIQSSDVVVRADTLQLTPTNIKNNKQCQILTCVSSNTL